MFSNFNYLSFVSYIGLDITRITHTCMHRGIVSDQFQKAQNETYILYTMHVTLMLQIRLIISQGRFIDELMIG